MKWNYGQTLLLLWSCATLAFNVAETMAEGVDFSDKSLQTIPKANGSSPVYKLVLRNNSITLNETDRDALASYPGLTELNLDENFVTTIPAEYFSVVPNLTVLSLSRNKIASLDPEALSCLSKLTVLDLSNNLLTSLPSNLTRGLNTLKVLRLQGNAWNCSGLSLRGIYQVMMANITFGEDEVSCGSPENQKGENVSTAVAACYPSPTTTTTSQTTPITTKQPWTSPVVETTPSSTTNKSLITDKKPAIGNSWKFTVSVLALALTTTLLIVCAIKGPSLYKVYHDYQHQRLGEDLEDENDNATSTDFPRLQLNHRTFSFTQEGWQVDGDEDEEEVYYEDPYVRRDERREEGADMSEA